MKRTENDLLAALQAQMSAIKSSGAAFDRGEKWEAMRLSSAIYVLVHDGGKRNRSLLTHLGAKGSMSFYSTGTVASGNMLSEMPLVIIRISGEGAEYLPKCVDPPPPPPELVQFHRWWESPIYKDCNGRILTRKNLVHSLRDQDGGGHFDEKLTDDAYIGVAKEGSAGWIFGMDRTSQRIEPGPHLATMRQIAWEMERSLTHHFPHLFEAER